MTTFDELLSRPNMMMSRRRSLPWQLVVAALLLGFLALVQLNQTLLAEQIRLESLLFERQQAQIEAREIPADVVNLQRQIAQDEVAIAFTDETQVRLTEEHIDWPRAMRAILALPPEGGISLLRLAQSERTVTIVGDSTGDEVLQRYKDQLEQSPYFEEVSITSAFGLSLRFTIEAQLVSGVSNE